MVGFWICGSPNPVQAYNNTLTHSSVDNTLLTVSTTASRMFLHSESNHKLESIPNSENFCLAAILTFVKTHISRNNYFQWYLSDLQIRWSSYNWKTCSTAVVNFDLDLSTVNTDMYYRCSRLCQISCTADFTTSVMNKWTNQPTNRLAWSTSWQTYWQTDRQTDRQSVTATHTGRCYAEVMQKDTVSKLCHPMSQQYMTQHPVILRHVIPCLNNTWPNIQ